MYIFVKMTYWKACHEIFKEMRAKKKREEKKGKLGLINAKKTADTNEDVIAVVGSNLFQNGGKCQVQNLNLKIFQEKVFEKMAQENQYQGILN